MSKKTEKFAEAAATVYVITQEDIHRGGSRSLAELCRELELQAREGELGQAGSLLEIIEAEYRQVCKALRNKLPK